MHFWELHENGAVFGELIVLVQQTKSHKSHSKQQKLCQTLASIFLNVAQLLFSPLQSRKNVCLPVKEVKVKHWCLYTHIVFCQRSSRKIEGGWHLQVIFQTLLKLFEATFNYIKRLFVGGLKISYNELAVSSLHKNRQTYE